MNVTLEKATMADADALVNIQKQAVERLYNIYHDEQSPYLRGTEEFERWFERGHYVYKIYADGTLAGGLTVFRSKTDAHEYYLARIYISPELQRHGIAKKQFDFVRKTILMQGVGFSIIRKIRLQINAVMRDVDMLTQAQGMS